jgi:hypothetical protein
MINNRVKIVIVVIIVSIMMIAIYNRHSKYRKVLKGRISSYDNNWNKVSNDILVEFMKRYGVPETFDGEGNGVGLWKNIEPYEIVEVRDNNEVPIYTWYRMSIPSYMLKNVYEISNNTYYDSDKALLCVKTNNMKVNVAITWVIKSYVSNKLTIDESGSMMKPLMDELVYNDKGEIKYNQLLLELKGMK